MSAGRELVVTERVSGREDGLKAQTRRQLFQIVGYAEGISYLVLLGIAMPLKYGLGMPEMTHWTGWIHGILFMVYNAAAVYVGYVERWEYPRFMQAFVASVLPFGTFVFDSKLQELEASET